MHSSILTGAVILTKQRAESSDESKNRSCIEGEEKGEVQHGHRTGKVNRLGLLEIIKASGPEFKGSPVNMQRAHLQLYLASE